MNTRKAGDYANDPEIFQAIWKHLKSDGVEDQAANQMTAEMIHHGEDFESSIDNEHAAQAMAVESLESGDNPGESIRFAGIYS